MPEVKFAVEKDGEADPDTTTPCAPLLPPPTIRLFETVDEPPVIVKQLVVLLTMSAVIE